ncbi:MAG: hypothetical protein ABIL58_18825 [Pseudomonadota bacterium]
MSTLSIEGKTTAINDLVLRLNLGSIESATRRPDGVGVLKAREELIGFLIFRGNWISDG